MASRCDLSLGRTWAGLRTTRGKTGRVFVPSSKSESRVERQRHEKRFVCGAQAGTSEHSISSRYVFSKGNGNGNVGSEIRREHLKNEMRNERTGEDEGEPSIVRHGARRSIEKDIMLAWREKDRATLQQYGSKLSPQSWDREWMLRMQSKGRSRSLTEIDKIELCFCAQIEKRVLAVADDFKNEWDREPTLGELALYLPSTLLCNEEKLEELLTMSRKARRLLVRVYRPLMRKEVNMIINSKHQVDTENKSLIMSALVGMNVSIDNYDMRRGSFTLFTQVNVRRQILAAVKRRSDSFREAGISLITGRPVKHRRVLSEEQQKRRLTETVKMYSVGSDTRSVSGDDYVEIEIGTDKRNYSEIFLDDVLSEGCKGEIDMMLKEMPLRMQNILRLRYGLYWDAEGILVSNDANPQAEVGVGGSGQDERYLGISNESVAKRYGISARQSSNLDKQARDMLAQKLTSLRGMEDFMEGW